MCALGKLQVVYACMPNITRNDIVIFFQAFFNWITSLNEGSGNPTCFVFQLRQSQSYCTDTGCPQECMYDHSCSCFFSFLFTWKLCCTQIRNISVDYRCDHQRSVWFQYRVPVVWLAGKMTWHFLWLWWDGWCWLCSCSCFAHLVSGVPVPQANPPVPIMSVLITLSPTEQ